MFAKMPPDRLKMHQKAFGGRAPPGPAGELKRSPDPTAPMGCPTSKGRGAERRGGDGKGRAPKLLLNHGPSEPCYATVEKDALECFGTRVLLIA